MRRRYTVAGLAALGAMLALVLSVLLGDSVWGQTTPKVSAPAPAKKWEAPAAEKAKKNPVPKTPESVAAGKKLAETNCAPCHGKAGKGDGEAAVALTPKPADWTSKAVQTEPEGSLFWKITKGNPPMPPWESLPEPDRWHLVNYIKTLGAPAAKAATPPKKP